MTRARGEPTDYVRALLVREREIPVVPAASRARAMARARAVVTAEVAGRRRQPRTSKAFRWVFTAGVVCVASLTGALAAYEVCAHAQKPRRGAAAAPLAVAPETGATPGTARRVEAPGAPASR